MKTVAEIAKMFGVTIPAVRYWIERGLPFTMANYVGFKQRKMIDPKDVVKHLGLTGEESEKYLRMGE
jgi:DNA-binding transcriptional MerR regulator